MVKIYPASRFDMNQLSEKMMVNQLQNEDLWDQIADALVARGYWIVDACLPDELLQGLVLRLTQLEAQGMKPAGVGRGHDFQQDQQVRGDKIHWLSDADPQEAVFLHWMDELRQQLNQRLYLGLVDYESHFAVYPAGHFYQKHLDAFREQLSDSRPQRKLSTVLYLNRDWNSTDAGELIIYEETGESIIEKVVPDFGRLVIFLSDKFPHEVKAALQTRRSIAGWFRSR